MRKNQLEIKAHYEIIGDLWWEGHATLAGSRYYTHDKDIKDGDIFGAPVFVKSLKDVLIDLTKDNGDFQSGTIKIRWLLIEVKYEQNLPAYARIGRTKIYTFEPDPARYPDYFVEQ